MKKGCSFLLLVLIFFLLSCPPTVGQSHYKSTHLEADLRDFVDEFYQWYIYAVKYDGDSYGLDFAKDSKGKLVVSAEAYLENLRSMGFISERFIEKESRRLQPCIDHLSGMNYRQFKRAGENAFQPECDCLYFPIYLGTTEMELLDQPHIQRVLRVKEGYIVEFLLQPALHGRAFFEREENVYRMVDLKVKYKG